MQRQIRSKKKRQNNIFRYHSTSVFHCPVVSIRRLQFRGILSIRIRLLQLRRSLTIVRSLLTVLSFCCLLLRILRHHAVSILHRILNLLSCRLFRSRCHLRLPVPVLCRLNSLSALAAHPAVIVLLAFLRNRPRNEGVLEDLIETVTLLNDTGSLLSILG